MKRLRVLVMAATLLGTMAVAPAAHAHWERYATAEGYQFGSTYDLFHFWAGNDGWRSYAGIQVDPFTGGRPIATSVLAQDAQGFWRTDRAFDFGPNVESRANGNMVAAEYRFRSGDLSRCTRWDFDPWNGWVQHWGGGTSERCPETFADRPGATTPISDLVIR